MRGFVFLLLLLLPYWSCAQSIIAMDPGSNFVKTVLVQPGKIFDVALSPDSKRKTYTGLAIVDGVRSYGGDAFNVYGKKPSNTVWRARDLVGRSPEDADLVEMMKKHHLEHQVLVKAEDGTNAARLVFGKGTKDEGVFTPEELFAMVINHCKENGERHGATKVTAVALTTPMFFNQQRRQGLMDAVEISGLTPLVLVDENGAAALQYALDRSFNESATNVLFFNMGAGSTQVSVVQITGGKDKRTAKEFRNVRVLGKAWDENLGSEDLDLNLAHLFAKEFDEKHPSKDNKIIDSIRAIVRLKKEGRLVKEILSGLEKFPVSFQALHRDVDFKSQVTRAQLEGISKETLERVRNPVERALLNAGLNMMDLHGVEVVGGGFRVPGVRDSLKKVFPSTLELGTHVNSDEGMAFGTAFCAANVSNSFHVPRLMTFQDAVPREVRVVLEGTDLARDAVLFSRFALIEAKEPTRQVIKFRHDSEFKVRLVEKKAEGDDSAAYLVSTVVAEYVVKGFDGAKQALGKYGEPKVHLMFSMDRSMMLSLESADARYEEEYEEIVKPTNSTKKTNDTEAAEVAAPVEIAVETKVKKIRKHKYVLTLERTDESVVVKRMTSEAKKLAQANLKVMDEQDKARSKKEEARNNLEAFSFVSKEKLFNAENKVTEVIDSAELDELRSELSSVEDWIDDHKSATADEFDQQRKKLSSKVEKIFLFIKEHEERPLAVKAFKQVLQSLQDRRANWTVERPWVPEAIWTVVDRVESSAKTWIDEMEKKQSELTKKQEPILTLSAIRGELEKIQKTVEMILKQRKSFAAANAVKKAVKDAEDASATKDEEKETVKDEETEAGKYESAEKEDSTTEEQVKKDESDEL